MKSYGQSMTDGDMGSQESSGAAGQGVQAAQDYDVGETGYKCLGTMPVTGGFFTREPQHGQA